MAKRVSGIATIAKSAVLWLTLAAVLGSAYGALLASRDAPTSFTLGDPAPVLAANEELAQPVSATSEP